jgi:hypothetical protein
MQEPFLHASCVDLLHSLACAPYMHCMEYQHVTAFRPHTQMHTGRHECSLPPTSHARLPHWQAYIPLPVPGPLGLSRGHTSIVHNEHSKPTTFPHNFGPSNQVQGPCLAQRRNNVYQSLCMLLHNHCNRHHRGGEVWGGIRFDTLSFYVRTSKHFPVAACRCILLGSLRRNAISPSSPRNRALCMHLPQVSPRGSP